MLFLFYMPIATVCVIKYISHLKNPHFDCSKIRNGTVHYEISGVKQFNESVKHVN